MSAWLLLVLVFIGGLIICGLVLLARQFESRTWHRSLLAYRLRLPSTLSIDDIAAWLATVNAATHAPPFSLLPSPPVALELVASKSGIEHMLLMPQTMQGVMLANLRSALPGVRIEAVPDYLNERPVFIVAAEATLTSHTRPLAHERAEVASSTILGALQPLYSHERVIIQWIITGGGLQRPIASVRASHGDSRRISSWPVDGQVSIDSEAVRAARAKQQTPILRSGLRIGVVAADKKRAISLFGRVWAGFRVLNAPGVGVVRRWRPADAVAGRMRSMCVPLLVWPLVLNTRELAGLIGFPVGGVHLPGVATGAARQLPTPASVPRSGAVLGVSNYPGSENRSVALARDDRLRHLWTVGPTGSGKSTLLMNLIRFDLESGAGIAVIDARGDLVSQVLAHVPDNRRDDVVLVDPSQTSQPVGFNILGIARGEQERELAVDHVLHIFQDLYRSSWGPRTADVLRAGVLTLMLAKASNGSAFTLVELPELLINDRLRHFIVNQPAVRQRTELVSFWNWYAELSNANRNDVIGPVLNKLRAFVLKTPLRLLLGQSTGIDLNTIFTQRKVLLVPLSRGTLGAETTQLVGSLVVASIWQLTLARVRIPPEHRRPVWLYADEFQETVRLPIDLADMLAQARGLGLGLTLAHQHLGQLPDALKAAVMSTARSQVAFQLDYADATTLGHSFSPLTPADLMGLERFEVAARLCVNGSTRSPVTLTTRPLPTATADPAELATFSQQRYGAERAEVEAALRARITVAPPDEHPGRSWRGGRS